MFKTLITLSFALLAVNLTQGWPPGPQLHALCYDILINSMEKWNKTVVESYQNSSLTKKVNDMLNKKDTQGLILAGKKWRCCVMTEIIEHIENDIKVIYIYWKFYKLKFYFFK